jgi:hypothetical protein
MPYSELQLGVAERKGTHHRDTEDTEEAQRKDKR